MAIIYMLIALIATTLGSMAGLGGGIIIKPALDALADFNVFVIGVLSSTTVMVMALVATLIQIKSGIRFNNKLLILACGSVVGGYIGKELFDLSFRLITEDQLTTLQAIMIIESLQLALYMQRISKKQISNKIWILLTGLVLGGISAFLGIGGGPLNVAVLSMIFCMDIKEAAAGSILIILFSQLSKLVSIGVTTGFGSYDYSVLMYMIPAGIVGGGLGSIFRKITSQKKLQLIFMIVVISIIILNIYNIVF